VRERGDLPVRNVDFNGEGWDGPRAGSRDQGSPTRHVRHVRAAGMAVTVVAREQLGYDGEGGWGV